MRPIFELPEALFPDFFGQAEEIVLKWRRDGTAGGKGNGTTFDELPVIIPLLGVGDLRRTLATGQVEKVPRVIKMTLPYVDRTGEPSRFSILFEKKIIRPFGLELLSGGASGNSRPQN